MKRLTRPKGKIAGICEGLGEYFDIDPAIVRIAFVIALFMGFGALLYLIMWVCVPKKTDSGV